MNILDKIIQQKKAEIKTLDYKVSYDKSFNTKNLVNALSKGRISIIAEIKFKSPSAGRIMDARDIIDIAKSYEKSGASALSILTDRTFFDGNIRFIEQVANHVSIPIIRKDFIISKRQIIESGIFSADGLLLIADILDEKKLEQLYRYASKLNIYTLIEVHKRLNLEKVLRLRPKIIGVNCRNLSTMETDISHFDSLIKELPYDIIKVAESGISSSREIMHLEDLGYDAVLIGTSLMKSEHPGNKLKSIIGEFV